MMKIQNTDSVVIHFGLSIIATFTLTVISTSPDAATITNIAQPTILVSTNPASFFIDAANLLVNPNNNPVEFSSSTHAAFGGLEVFRAYDSNNLASLLGVPQTILSNTDFIAFDNNGQNSGGGGFEDSVWSFTDGVNSLTHNHDFLDGLNGPVLANNEQLNVGDQYNSVFGTSFSNGEDFGVLLFDLSSSGIDVKSSNFEVTLQGGGLTCGNECPDVTFMGTVSTVPIPSALVLFFSGLLGLSSLIRRRVA
jgi:hypothetical protein